MTGVKVIGHDNPLSMIEGGAWNTPTKTLHEVPTGEVVPTPVSRGGGSLDKPKAYTVPSPGRAPVSRNHMDYSYWDNEYHSTR